MSKMGAIAGLGLAHTAVDLVGIHGLGRNIKSVRLSDTMGWVRGDEGVTDGLDLLVTGGAIS